MSGHLLVARLMKRDISHLLYIYAVDRKHVRRLYVI